MKRLLFLLFILATAFTATAQERATTPAQKRKLERQQAQAVRALAVQEAVANGNFYFMGREMQLSNLDRITLLAPYDFVDVTPDKLTLRLPYYTSKNTMSGTWPLLDFTTTNFSYTVNEQKGVFTITIEAKDVVDRDTVPRATQSRSYKLIFVVAGDGGNTTLSVTPSFTGPVSYTGTFQNN